MAKQVVDIEMWADISTSSKTVTVPVMGYQCQFARNSIPTAEIKIPVGYEATSKNLSSIHGFKTADEMRNATIKVMFKADGEGWDPGERLVFEGVVNNYGFQFGERMTLVLTANHWLFRLNDTSWAHPYLDQSAPPIMGLTGKSEWTSLITMSTFDYGIFKRDYNAAAKAGNGDLWKELIKPIFLKGLDLAGQEVGWLKTLLKDANIGKGDDTEIKAALERINPDDTVKVIPDLAIQVGLTYPIANKVALLASKTMDKQTMWDRLLITCSAFGMVLSPAIERATLFPYNPVMPEGKEHVTLTMDDNLFIAAAPNLARRKRGLVFIGGHGLQSIGIKDGKNSGKEWLNSAGFYLNPNISEQDGTILVQDPPGWLDREMGGGYVNSGTKKVMTNNNADDQKPDKDKKHALEASGMRSLGNAVAEFKYYESVIASQRIAIRTDLRFDIAPGATIALQWDDYATLPPVPGFSEGKHLGNVASVEIMIDDESRQVMTSLQIDSFRLAANKDYTMDTHPLYKTTWSGGPLWE